MSYKEWAKKYGYIRSDIRRVCEEAFQAGAASRDAEVQRLQIALADTEALELGTAEKCDQLRAELVKALAACKVKDAAITEGLETYKIPMTARIVEALAIQPDDSALKAFMQSKGVSYE